MEEYKKLIGKFLEDIEKLDCNIEIDKLNGVDLCLFDIIRGCRNKLMDVYNKIGDDVWVMPDMEFRIT